MKERHKNRDTEKTDLVGDESNSHVCIHTQTVIEEQVEVKERQTDRRDTQRQNNDDRQTYRHT